MGLVHQRTKAIIAFIKKYKLKRNGNNSAARLDTGTEFHPIANLFPLMVGQEFEDLVGDIRRNGLRNPIHVYEGKILDGRNRLRACAEAGVKPKFQELNGHGSPLDFVLSMNLTRRHLTPSQKAAVAVEILPWLEKKAKERQRLSRGRGKKGTQTIAGVSKGEAREQAAQIVKANRQYIQDAKKLSKEDPKAFAAVKAGELTIPEVKRERRREERIVKAKTLAASMKELNGELGKFPVIYCDPPWEYECAQSDSRKVENQYPTMTLKELCDLSIGEIVAPDAVLFMWTTSPKLKESLQVMEAWGFQYRTCAVWVKERIGMGYYFRQQHELLLVGKKGELPPPPPGTRISSVMVYPRGIHSEKPLCVFRFIEDFYPGLPRIQLFTRQEHDGWTAWGNEL